MVKDWTRIKDDRQKYSAYLCSREWNVLKEAVKKRANGRCERCNVLPMSACHHLNYDNKYHESLDDLQAICQPCHEFTHGKDDFDPVPNSRFIQWLTYTDGAPTWLSHCWQETWLTECFNYPTLPPVLQMFVSFKFAQIGGEEAIDSFAECRDKEGVQVGDFASAIPTQSESIYVDSLGPHEAAFYRWLRWSGPSQYPPRNRDAYQRCLELSASLRAKGQ